MNTSYTVLGILLSLSSVSSAHQIENQGTKPVLASLENLHRLQVPIWASDDVTGIGFAYLTPAMQEELLNLNHAQGKCGGFEVLDHAEAASLSHVQKTLQALRQSHNQHQSELRGPLKTADRPYRQEIQTAVGEIQPQNIQDLVKWLSSYPTRNEKSAQKNAHVLEMKKKAEDILKTWSGLWSVDLIDHTSTQQKSLRVRMTGSAKPQELVILGGHHDSTVGWGATAIAPGADDNASGSAGLLEILRVLASKEPSARTIELMWYAAEESGLLGSAEIAKTYKAEKKNVLGVLQMDMTAYAGSGVGRITNVTDFTSPVLQDLIKQLNQHYTGLEIIDDKCGYACSDHASWHRQGFAAVLPFEAITKDMNPQIHTKQDLIGILNFDHAAMITRLSLAFAMELANQL